jgi:hypothetical protein
MYCMGWKHVVVEGHCFYDVEENKPENIPQCCQYSPGNVGLHCLKHGEGKYFPFFAFGTARASVIVIDGTGEAVNGTCFFPDNAHKLSDTEFVEQEKEWEKNGLKRFPKTIINNKEGRLLYRPTLYFILIL